MNEEIIMRQARQIISIYIVLMFSISVVSAAGEPASGIPQGKEVNEISASHLHQMMEKKDFILVNVHVPYAGEIPETDRFIPFNKITGHLDKLPAKGQNIVVYCRSDHMSTIAAEKLAKEGYSKIYNLKGGMKAWKDKEDCCKYFVYDPQRPDKRYYKPAKQYKRSDRAP